MRQRARGARCPRVFELPAPGQEQREGVRHSAALGLARGEEKCLAQPFFTEIGATRKFLGGGRLEQRLVALGGRWRLPQRPPQKLRGLRGRPSRQLSRRALAQCRYRGRVGSRIAADQVPCDCLRPGTPLRQERRHPAMLGTTPGGRDAVVGERAEQRLGEFERRADPCDPGRDQIIDGVTRLVLREFGHARGNCDLRAFAVDRQQGERRRERLCRGTETPEAQRQVGGDGRRTRRTHPPDRQRGRWNAGLLHGRGHLGGQKGGAAGPLVAGPREVGLRRRAQPAIEQGGDSGLRKRPGGDGRGVRLGREGDKQARVVPLSDSRGDDHRHRQRFDPRCEAQKDPERLGIAPLCVVDRDRHRPGQSEVDEQPVEFATVTGRGASTRFVVTPCQVPQSRGDTVVGGLFHPGRPGTENPEPTPTRQVNPLIDQSRLPHPRPCPDENEPPASFPSMPEDVPEPPELRRSLDDLSLAGPHPQILPPST